MGTCKNCIAGCHTCILLEDSNAKRLIDRVNKYQAMGYHLDTIWYNHGFLWRTRYYAKLKLDKGDNCSPKIEFSIGPVSQV